MRARHATLVVVDFYPTQDHCIGERPLSIGARPCRDVPAAVWNTQPAFAWRTRERATALDVSQDEAQHARCDARAPCCAGNSRLVPYAGPLHRRDVSLHRPKTVVRRASCSLQGTAGFRVPRTRVCHCTHCLAKRAPCRAGCYRVMQHGRPLHRREASLHRRETVVRRASCGFQHTAGFRVASTRARHCACCLSGGGTVRLLATRACRAALVVVALCTRQGHFISERPPSIGARPWCDVPATASNTQPALALCARERATALAVLGERRSTRACDARAPCRAGFDRITYYTRPLHQREASLHRRKTVVRQASYVL